MYGFGLSPKLAFHYTPTPSTRRWILDKPGVAGVSLGARNASHLGDYKALFSFNMDAEDNAAIAEVGLGKVLLLCACMCVGVPCVYAFVGQERPRHYGALRLQHGRMTHVALSTVTLILVTAASCT